MGLDIDSEDGQVELLHMAYSAFMRFRNYILTLKDDEKKQEVSVSASSTFEEGSRLFKTHSDCDGEWSPNECKQVSEYLESKLPLIADDLDLGGHLVDFKKQVITLIKGLQYCVENKQKAMFH